MTSLNFVYSSPKRKSRKPLAPLPKIDLNFSGNDGSVLNINLPAPIARLPIAFNPGIFVIAFNILDDNLPKKDFLSS